MASSSGSKKYKLVRKIRSGSFWDLYLAIDITNGEQVAVKLESQKARHPQFKLCEILQGRLGIPHIPWRIKNIKKQDRYKAHLGKNIIHFVRG
uniref:Uncharacterized protein n=1 Tax=Pan troglodytes TaxID=9598 RepID=A0A2I3T438_PANTR